VLDQRLHVSLRTGPGGRRAPTPGSYAAGAPSGSAAWAPDIT
jgi:hypothetical protein